ncbi:MAG: hypothetical protein JXA89_08135 [Anaerolineae bacterium]|nr:hypothetical protein [Anaerolineae bacterium]
MSELDKLQNKAFDREEYDHGVDEYVSACNEVPYSTPSPWFRPVNREQAESGLYRILRRLVQQLSK